MGVLDLFRLDGKRAIVVGGARGIGFAAATAIAEAGAALTIADINAVGASESAGRLAAATGRTVTSTGVDVTDEASVAALLDHHLAEHGGVELLINCAGIAFHEPAESTSFAEWKHLFAVNLEGSFLTCRIVGGWMLNAGGGSIVNVASMSAQAVNHPQKQTAYNASKAGVVQMTRSLATEWADRGVRVNSISPGYTATEMTMAPAVRDMHALWNELTPMGRLCEPAELQGAFLYLLSEASSYVTGHDLVVDGGYTLW